MTDRVHPSSKPSDAAVSKPSGTVTNGGATANNPRSFPPTKAQLFNPNRHPYRPQPTTQKRPYRRRCRCSLCKCCFCTLLIITLIILLAAIAGAIAYLLYNPHRPTFSISSLKITQFNLTTAADDSTYLTTKLNITLSSKNSNKKAVFFYDPIAIAAEINQVQIANGSFQSFTSNPNNITIIHSTLYSNWQVLDADSATVLRSDLRKKTKLPLKILLDTQVRVRLMESDKSKKVGIRITCEGIKAGIPKGKSSPSVATVSDPKCKVDLRITIWKWTF